VRVQRAISANVDTVCYITSNTTASTVWCWDGDVHYTVATTSQSLNLVTVSLQAVCWQTIQGQAYCYSFLNGDTEQINPQSQIVAIGTGIQPYEFGYYVSVLDARTGSITQNLNTIPTQFSFSTALYTGNSGMCAVYNSALSFSCLPSQTQYSDNLNPAGFGNSAIVQMAYNTYSTLWANANGQLGGFGLQTCPLDTPSCTSAIQSLGVLNLPLPPLTSVSRVSADISIGCAVHHNSASCWGFQASTNPSITSLLQTSGVVDVAAFATGVCLQYSNGDIVCSSTGNSFRTSSLYVPNACLQCASYSLAARDTCFTCAVGNDLVYDSFSEVLCLPCPFGTYRSYADLSCTQCPIGSQTNFEQSQCLPCAPAYYWSNSMCLECGPGSTSTPDNLSCQPCPVSTARPQGQPQCGTCPNLSLPSADQSFCQSCTLPNYLVFDSLTQFFFDSGTCTRCPDGYYVTPFNFSCSLCTFSTIRNGLQPSCTDCPAGSASDNLHTVCEPCIQGTVRAPADPQCYVCPSGFEPQGLILCLPFEAGPIINPYRTVGYTVGAAIIAFGLLFKPELSLNAAIIIITIGILAMIGSGLVHTIPPSK